MAQLFIRARRVARLVSLIRDDLANCVISAFSRVLSAE
jgi:hypothetical protein